MRRDLFSGEFIRPLLPNFASPLLAGWTRESLFERADLSAEWTSNDLYIFDWTRAKGPRNLGQPSFFVLSFHSSLARKEMAFNKAHTFDD